MLPVLLRPHDLDAYPSNAKATNKLNPYSRSTDNNKEPTYDTSRNQLQLTAADIIYMYLLLLYMIDRPVNVLVEPSLFSKMPSFPLKTLFKKRTPQAKQKIKGIWKGDRMVNDREN